MMYTEFSAGVGNSYYVVFSYY